MEANVSNPQFQRVLSSHEYETFTFPKEILYDENLTGDSVKLLLIMLDYGKRPNWQLRQTHLLAISGFKYTKFSNAMKTLEKAGYVQRTRQRVKGRWTPYFFKFCAFPVFRDDENKNPAHIESEPVEVFQTGLSKLENRNFTYSKNNVLVETTNYPPPEEGDLVSSSFERREEIESIPNLSESQKNTLYKRYTTEQIINGLKCFDVDKADSVFAMLICAIDKKWKPIENKTLKNLEAIEIVKKADAFIASKGSCPISVGLDEKNAYIHVGTSICSFSLNDPNFKTKFVDAVNKHRKG